MKISKILFTIAVIGSLSVLSACAPQKNTGSHVPDLPTGVVSFFQPMSMVELMAGYIPDNQGHIDAASLERIDTILLSELDKTTRTYKYIPPVSYAEGKEVGLAMRKTRHGALSFWVEIGKREGVDILIVPTVIDWHERQGGEMGVSTSASVTTDIFLIDCRGEGALLQRSFYNEKQTSLSGNLLSIGDFFKRGGKWVTAEELTREAVEKAILEFGL